MDIFEFSKLFELISSVSNAIDDRMEVLNFRNNSLTKTAEPAPKSLVKLAFDTRRVDQETYVIPRRNLQNYHRSEQFLTEAMDKKIIEFKRLKGVLEDLKNVYGKNHEWQDSYARILLNTLDKSLRIEERDGDYTSAQPGVGNFDYIEELLFVRYRLNSDNMSNMNDEQIKKIILNKDENLLRNDIVYGAVNPQELKINGDSAFLERLFGQVKATKENPEVERTVTITIKDKLRE